MIRCYFFKKFFLTRDLRERDIPQVTKCIDEEVAFGRGIPVSLKKR